MRGKIGLVVGIGIGYVLGTRAGRERYEQIKKQAIKVWELDPVQAQVDKVKDFAKSTAMAVPGALWNGAVKIGKAVSSQGTPGERLDSTIKAADDSVGDVKKAADKTLDEAKSVTDKTLDRVKKKLDDAEAPGS